METPLQLAWIHVDPSDALTALVRKEVERIEHFHGRITGCAVTLEAPSQHHRHSGTQDRVRIELTMPRGRVVVGRDPPKSQLHADPYAAVKEAFREARRQLEDHVRRLDGRVKTHVRAARAVVDRLFPTEGYGFLRTPDDREIYFHAHSVLRDGFAALRVGSTVRFAEELGDDGPQASTVALVRRRAAPGPAPDAR